MKILFKNKTKYTKEAYENFLIFHQKKYGTKYKISTAIIIILVLFCSLMNIKYGNQGIGVILLIIAIGILFYRFYNPIKKIEKESNSEKLQKEKEFTFSFYEHYMHVSGNGINAKVRYWKIRKAYEDKEYIYLYIDKEYAFLINKEGFSIGKCKDFIPFIKKKSLFKI